MIIAIQPDDYTNPKVGKCDASSPRWAELLEKAGHQVRWVNVFRSDILDQIKGCDGFMWRHANVAHHRQIARRLLPVVERELGLPVYPDQATCWHYDDKIAQYYLFNAAGIPTPKTWVCFDREEALEVALTADYPLVTKLWSGSASGNVHLVRNFTEARQWIDQLFGRGVGSAREYGTAAYHRFRYAVKVLLTNRPIYHMGEIHRNYVLLQEFLADNPFDIRIAVIGNRAFGLRRFNRPNDFRASGSGNFDVDPAKIDLRAVRLGFSVAKKLKTQEVNLDILHRGNDFVIGEISYTTMSWFIQGCLGHWKLEKAQLVWVPGQMWPEEAQIQDFLVRLGTGGKKTTASVE
jgi:glutathione synthase/RimK-type ligase-like ATP-grasp enzyme